MSDLKKIWKKVKPTIEVINSYYFTISDPLSDNDARKLYTIRLYFIRGIFEEVLEQHDIEKNKFNDAMLFLYREFVLLAKKTAVDKDQAIQIEKNSYDYAEGMYETTKKGISKNKSYKDKCVNIINSGKSSYKKGGMVISTASLGKIFNNKKNYI